MSERSKRCAICILATGDYHVGARVMFYTLRKYGGLHNGSGVDCYAMGANGNVPIALAQDLPITTDYSKVPVSQKNFPQVARKFQALQLPYRRIILMDADMVCIGDCSYLWSDVIGGLPFYACRDTASVQYYGKEMEQMAVDIRRNFNGGLMVFNFDHLRSDTHDHLIKGIGEGLYQAYDGGDQGYLNHYFQREEYEVGFLPPEYNESYDRYMPTVPKHAKRIIHFTGGNANPWAPHISSGDPRWEWIKFWQREYEECR